MTHTNKLIEALNEIKKDLVLKRRDLSIAPTSPDKVEKNFEIQQRIDALNRAIEDEINLKSDVGFNWGAV